MALKIDLGELRGGRGREFKAPWENLFLTVYTPFDEFIHRQSTSGILLLSCGVLALVFANSPLSDAYLHLLHKPVGLQLGDRELVMSLHHWINDGLMTLFFLLVGLELKREFLVGELSDFRKALMPAIAAVGGMVVPALCYLSLNPSGDGLAGWGIPMATDIAFAVGTIALLGNRVPRSLLIFLVALAIVDDLGAILVIALFYTQQLHFDGLLWAGAVATAMVVLNFFGVRRNLPYLLLTVVLWLALHYAGVHATLAGVICAFIIPARPKYDPEAFSSQARRLLAKFDRACEPGLSLYDNSNMRAYLHALERVARLVRAPLQRLEHSLHIPVTYLVIPLFALANAGIPLSVFSVGEDGFSSITLGVMLGLVLGKPLGIAGSTLLAWKLGLGKLPEGCHMGHVLGVSLLGGIGFTMSIFIAELAFAGADQNLLYAKAGVLAGSLIAGIAGAAVLYGCGGSREGVREADIVV